MKRTEAFDIRYAKIDKLSVFPSTRRVGLVEGSSLIFDLRYPQKNGHKYEKASGGLHGTPWTKPQAIESLDWLHLLAQGSTLGVACPKSGFDQREYELQPTSRLGGTITR
ncbi:hypothetical protein ABZX51_011077 [Aspergillus tubingensis]